jgi:hypothetical protein
MAIAPAGRRTRGRRRRGGSRPAAGRLSFGTQALLFAAFLGVALIAYEPALTGAFVSDDHHYVSDNAYVHELSLENIAVILDPLGDATHAVVNYTPVHLMIHAVAWEVFGDRVLGHHLVNLVFHSLASVLLVALFLRTGIPRAAALLGGALFLLHPANVEAVAWISQLKSSSSMVLSLLALLAMPRRPALACLLFGLALLAKPTAAFVLPVAALFEWSDSPEGRVRWGWYAVMGVLLAGYAAVELIAHQRSGAAEAVLYRTPLVLLRTILGLALRYLVMSTTTWGLSAFHEPEPAYSPWNPWWLGSLVALALLGWRFVLVLRARRPEAAYWAWAVVSFGPVSQVFPFLHPLADRYLYFILPGLLGGALLAGAEGVERLAASRADPGRARRLAARAGVALGVAVAVGFGLRAHQRATVWRSDARVIVDAAQHYPDGRWANLLRGKRAALAGDVDGAVAGIRGAMERGYNRFDQLLNDPAWAPVRDDRRFQALVRELAAGWIARIAERDNPTQLELQMAAHAHLARNEKEQAVAMFRRALARGGKYDAQMRAYLVALGSAEE